MTTGAPRPEVFYVCVRNAGRSQMAALFTSRLGGERVAVRSAGRVNQRVNRARGERWFVRIDRNGGTPMRGEGG